MTQKQERLMWTEISFILGKNGSHMASNLSSRSIVVVIQANKTLAAYEILKISMLHNSKVILMSTQNTVAFLLRCVWGSHRFSYQYLLLIKYYWYITTKDA